MVTYGNSYPLPGAGGMTDANWRNIASAWGDGLVNSVNPGGSSDFSVTPSTSTRTVTLNLGQIRIRGVQFEQTQATLALSIPDIVTAGNIRSDRIVARYDPAAAVADRIVFQFRAGTEVAATATPPRPGLTRVAAGAWEIPLWLITGGNVAANALEYEDHRVWVGNRLHVNSEPGPNTQLNQGYPDGTQAFHLPRRETWVQTYPGGVATWTNVDRPDWRDITLAGSGALAAQGTTPAYCRVRGEVRLRGAVRRTAGTALVAAGAVADLGTLPVGYRPGATEDWGVGTTFTGGAHGARVYIGTDGVIHVTAPADTGWVSLSGVRFYAEN